MRIKETKKAINWWKNELSTYLKEVKHEAEVETFYVCSVCGSKYTNKEAAMSCKHGELFNIKRCCACGKLLDVFIPYNLVQKLLREGKADRHMEWEEYYVISFGEMEMRGLGSGGGEEFCSMECLEEWVKRSKEEKVCLKPSLNLKVK